MTNIIVPKAAPSQEPRSDSSAWRRPNVTLNASDDKLEEASESCETWAKRCAAVVVIAVVVELVLAVWHPPYDSDWNRWISALADALIAVGIVGEVSFAMRGSRYQSELRRRSNKELAEAKLELARVATPRVDVLLPHKAKIIEKLLPFAGTKFDVGHSEHGREEWDFVWHLEEIPAKAGWEFVNWDHGPVPQTGRFAKYNWEMRRHTYGIANVSNVVIELEPENREKLLPAATALVDALKEVGISASVAQIRINAISGTKDAIHILVGPKE